MLERLGGSTKRSRVGAARSRAPSGRQDRILEMQEQAGNAAVSSLLTAVTVQRAPGAQPAITFVIKKPGDTYTKQVGAYVGTTLQSPTVAVNNLDDICAYVTKLPAGTQFSTVRIVSHGQSDTGAVGMTPS